MHCKNIEVWTVGWTNQASVVGNFNGIFKYIFRILQKNSTQMIT